MTEGTWLSQAGPSLEGRVYLCRRGVSSGSSLTPPGVSVHSDSPASTTGAKGDGEEILVIWPGPSSRGWRTESSRIDVLTGAFGDQLLDELAPAAIERFLDGLLTGRSQSTRNRYRTLLHAMLNRAVRHGL